MTLSLQPVAECRTRYGRWSGLFGVRDGVTGRVVPRLAPDVLGEETVAPLSDAERRERLGRVGDARMTQASPWQDVADRMAPRIEQAAGL